MGKSRDIIIRDMMQQPEKKGIIQGSALFIKFIAALIIYLIILVYSFFNFEADVN